MAFDYKSEYERYKHYYRDLEPTLKKSDTRGYTAVIFSFLVVSLFGWYAIRPTVDTILRLRREIADKTTLGQQMEQKISSLIEAQATYQDIQEYLPALDDALPNSPKALELVAQLRNLAAANNVTLKTIQLPSVPLKQEATPAASTAPVMTMPKQNEFLITLTVEGPYQNDKAFLASLTTLRRLITVTAINMTPIKTSGSTILIASPSGDATESAAIVQSTSTQNVQLVIRAKTYYLTP